MSAKYVSRKEKGSTAAIEKVLTTKRWSGGNRRTCSADGSVTGLYGLRIFDSMTEWVARSLGAGAWAGKLYLRADWAGPWRGILFSAREGSGLYFLAWPSTYSGVVAQKESLIIGPPYQQRGKWAGRH